MTAPLNTSQLLQVVADTGSETFTPNFTLTKGRPVILSLVHYSATGSISAVTIGGTPAKRVISQPTGSGSSAQQWFADDIEASTNHIVVSYSAGADNYVSGAIQEFARGALTGPDWGAEAGATGSSAAPSVQMARTPRAAHSILVAIAGPDTAISNNNLAAPAGWSQVWVEQNSSATQAGCGAWKLLDAGTRETATFSMTSGAWYTCIAAYGVAKKKQAKKATRSIRRNFDLKGWFNVRADAKGWFWRGWSAAASPDVTRALTGSAITSAAGTLGVTADKALTGEAATGSTGTLNAAQPLTGTAASLGAGTLVPESSIALTGTAATASQGSVGASISIALTGQAITAAQGSLTPALAVTLAGTAATGSTGTLAPQASVAVTGSAASASAGTLVPATAVPLNGAAITGEQGSVTVEAGSDINVALTGQAITAAQGSLGVTREAALAGEAITATPGTLTPATSKAIAGEVVTAQQGSTAATIAPALAGSAATAGQGSLGVALTVPVTGSAVTGSQGNVTAVTGIVVALTGQAISMSAGSVGLGGFGEPGGRAFELRDVESARPRDGDSTRPPVISGARPGGINSARPPSTGGRRL